MMYKQNSAWQVSCLEFLDCHLVLHAYTGFALRGPLDTSTSHIGSLGQKGGDSK